MSVLDLWFAWPAGQVWPNLVAAVIGSGAGGVLVAWRALVKMDRKHEAHRQQLAAQIAEHHQAVLAAVASKETP